MGLKYDVIVVGDYCLDLIFTGLPKLPALGIEVVGTGFDMLPGWTYTTAIALHRLGVNVGWACDFGTDEFSQFTIRAAQREGIDSALFVHHSKPLRRITVAASYPQDRAFIAYYDPDPAMPAAIKALSRASARAVYIPGLYHGPALGLGLKLIRAKKMKIIMDGNSLETDTLSDPGVKKAIQSADLFMPNRREALRLTEEGDIKAAGNHLGNLCPLVVIKDGPMGAYAIHNGSILHSPAIDAQPLDTTGAGDCFNAGFIFAWLQELPLHECLRWGNIVGGLSTLAAGGTGRKITQADVRGYLEKEFGN